MATRKETLLIEIYNLRNQISELKGKEQTDIEQFTKSTQFYNELNLERVPTQSTVGGDARCTRTDQTRGRDNPPA